VQANSSNNSKLVPNSTEGTLFSDTYVNSKIPIGSTHSVGINLTGQKKKSKGLTDGYGLINGNGLTDGNGLTIKFYSSNKYEKKRIHRSNRLSHLVAKNKKRKIFESLIIVILILLPLTIYMVDLNTSEKTIMIDGEFQDWNSKDVNRYMDVDPEPIINPSTNIVDCRLYFQNNILDFYIQTELNIFGNDHFSNRFKDNHEAYKLDIFIDRDLSQKTGYLVNGLGADERIELQGKNGAIETSYSYYFDQTSDNMDHNGWVRNSNVDYAKEKLRLEGRHYLSTVSQDLKNNPDDQISNIDRNHDHKEFGEKSWHNNVWPEQDDDDQLSNLGVTIQLSSSTGDIDSTPTIITGTSKYFDLSVNDISPEFIIPDENPASLIEFNFFTPKELSNERTQNSQGFEIKSMKWECNTPKNSLFSEQFDQLTLQLFSDMNLNHKQDHYDEELQNYEFSLTSDHELSLEFSPSLEINEADLCNYIITISSQYNSDLSDSWLFKINPVPIEVIASSNVKLSESSYSGQETALYIGYPPKDIKIDGIFYDWTNEDSTKLVDDLDIPQLEQIHYDQNINEAAVDIDYDSGIVSCYLSVNGYLLNGNSIPPIFYSKVLSETNQETPTKNNVQNSSTEGKLQNIHNPLLISQLPKQLLGTDTISIFIDYDKNTHTGFNPGWLGLGAEYRIEISGRDGWIRYHDLFSYQGFNNDNWSWQRLGFLPVGKNHRQLETQINWRNFGIDQRSDIDIVYFVSDWSGKHIDSIKLSQTDSWGININDPLVIFNDKNEPNIEFSNNQDNQNIEQIEEPLSNRTRAGYFVNTTTDLGNTIKFPNQRKLVRDINGYWYAFWVENNQLLKGIRSTDTNGQDWSADPVLLAGTPSAVINNAKNKSIDPAVDIHIDTDINKNEIHLVWGMDYNGNIALMYSKCTNISTNAKFISPTSWCKADNTTGYDVIDEYIDNGTLIKNNYGKPSIAVDTLNRPHIVWQYEHDNNKFYVNYTRYDFTNNWHNGQTQPIRISPNPIDNHRTPTIDIGHNGTIHVAYTYYSGLEQIKYRQCWDITNSMNLNYWGDASRTTAGEDTPIFSATNHVNEPSLICDAQGRVWIVTYESAVWDILFSMEDFQDTTYWPGPFVIASSGENRYPTISYDTSGIVYCVWQHKEGLSTFNISFSSNSSSGWSTAVEIASGNDFVYPQIPKNLSIYNKQISFVYKNETDDGLMFESIPEIPVTAQIFILIILLNLVIISIRRKPAINAKNIGYLKEKRCNER
jgi:hypothetical protein